MVVIISATLILKLLTDWSSAGIKKSKYVEMSVFALELQFMTYKIFWSRTWTQLVRRSQERGKEIVTLNIIKSEKKKRWRMLWRHAKISAISRFASWWKHSHGRSKRASIELRQDVYLNDRLFIFSMLRQRVSKPTYYTTVEVKEKNSTRGILSQR